MNQRFFSTSPHVKTFLRLLELATSEPFYRFACNRDLSFSLIQLARSTYLWAVLLYLFALLREI